jgi:hypothetical protein
MLGLEPTEGKKSKPFCGWALVPGDSTVERERAGGRGVDGKGKSRWAWCRWKGKEQVGVVLMEGRNGKHKEKKRKKTKEKERKRQDRKDDEMSVREWGCKTAMATRCKIARGVVKPRWR